MIQKLFLSRNYIRRFCAVCFIQFAFMFAMVSDHQSFAQTSDANRPNSPQPTVSGERSKFSAPAQNDDKLISPAMPFSPVEYLVYEGEYSKLLLRGIKVAELSFVARHQNTNPSNGSQPAADQASNQPLLFTGDIVSQGFFRKLFSLNFRYQIESKVQTETFRTVSTSNRDEQNKRLRTSVALFDYAKNKVTWTERDPNQPQNEPRVVTSELDGTTLDILSGIYALRMRPLAVGDKFELRVSESGKVYTIPVRVVERKKIKSVLGERMTLRVELDLFGDDRLVRDEGEFSIWFTDDARRVPVKARVSHKIGTLDITLKSISNVPK